VAELVQTDAGTFTAELAGPEAGPLVVLLHGFPQSRHTWRHQVPALAAAGYRALAPDQRGYSPGARPDPAVLAHYGIDRLVADVLSLADVVGPAGRPFHLVGHDWGGQVAWATAARHPERTASLTVLSRPHPAAFREAMAQDADGQRHRSRHHRSFHDPETASLLVEAGGRRLRRSLADQGVGPAAVEEYLGVLQDEAAVEAALAWYRAAGALTALEVGPIEVPTLYLWGDADATVGPTAARGTARHVTGPYRFEVLDGVGHFATDQAPERVTAALLAHLAAT
jgi:pimeloyl-ACP methyl ester carboxylesterase